MTEFFDFSQTPLRNILGPVYDAYRKSYEYLSSIVVPGDAVSTIEGAPLPDMYPDRQSRFYYGVYGPPDNPVKADIVGTPATVLTQTTPEDWERFRIDNSRKKYRPVEWLPSGVPTQEIFVDMPYALPSDLPCSTVSTRHA